MRVGIPRALLYHHYGDGWVSFLEDLGCEVVVTPATTSATVVSGASCADNETCLPVKVFAGHLLELREGADAILVPRVISQYRGTKACPKYLGLPDLARALEPDLPPVLAPLMDLADRKRRWARDWYALARGCGAGDHAASSATRKMLGSLRSLDTQKASLAEPGAFTVGVAGHLYNVHDQRVSLGLVERIRAMGAEVATVEQVPRARAHRQLKTLGRRIRWDFEGRLVGAVLDWSRTSSVAGIIYVSSFACGPGSMIGALLEDQLRRERSVPMMMITMDEHSAEGGLVTRVEAFLDMLKRAPGGVRPTGTRRAP